MRRVVVPILSACLALSACSMPVAGFPRYNSPPAEAQLIQSAYDVLVNDYVLPLDPVVLGLAAATGMRDAVAAQAGAAAAQAFPYQSFQGDGAAVRYEIAQQYEAVMQQYPTLKTSTVADDAMDRMAQSVNDCHTNFFTPAEYQDQQAAIQGTQQFGGIGASLKDRPGDAPLIGEVFSGLPAAKAGLRRGDAIERVDGKDVRGISAVDVVKLIRGPVGSVVHLDVERAGNGVLHFNITRENVTPPALDARGLSDPNSASPIGYIHIYDFTPDMPQELAGVLQQFGQHNADLWLLDLRDNSGGTVQSLTEAASLFLPQGPIATVKNRAGQAQEIDATGQTAPPPRKLVVLVNNGTASAAEIMAAALQERGVATVVGGQTAGCVAVGEMHPLADGSALEYAADRVFTPNGVLLNGTGVTPDVPVKLTLDELAAGQDPQLAAAVAVLDGRLAPKPAASAAPSTSAPVAAPPKLIPGRSGA